MGLIRRIDELHLAHPFMGARMLRDQLARQGIQAGRRHVTALMQRMGSATLAHRLAITLEAIHAKEVIELALSRYGAPEIVNTGQGSQFTA